MTHRGPQGIRVIEYNITDAKGTLHEIQAGAVISSEIKDRRLHMLTRDDKSSSGQPSLVIRIIRNIIDKGTSLTDGYS
jgi:hypothetical protein